MPDGDAAARDGFSTIAVHAGSAAARAGDPVASEIFQTSTFVSDPLGEGEVLYSRYGNNPNQRRLEEKIARLENAEACLVTSSGMAAMAAAILSVAKAGDHVLAASALYGGTRIFLDRELSRLGITSSYADFFSESWVDEIRPETKVILGEVPTNPLMRVLDPAPQIAAARRIGAISILDVTFATPINLRALDLGVDLVVHSATKYLGGHSDVTAGALCGAAELVDRARDRAQLFGTALDPHAAWLVERGTKTLALRMARHNENGMKVARWLEEQPEVERVHYPGLDSHRDHAVAAQLLGGYGGMVGVELIGEGAYSTKFLQALRLCTVAPSLGGVETLASQPRHTSHVKMSVQEREAVGIREGLIRFSLGIEDAADLIGDMRQALDNIVSGSGDPADVAARQALMTEAGTPPA